MKYTDEKVYEYLTSNDKDISNYIVILGTGDIYDTLFYMRENCLFIMMIDDDDMYFSCVDYIKRQGKSYTENEFKQKFPHIYCG